MTVVLLGNDNPQNQVDGVIVPAEHLNQSVTRLEMWEGFDDPDLAELTLSTNNDRILSMIARSLGDEFKRYAIGINEVEQTLAVHSAGTAPAWVDSDDEDFARVLGEYFDCHVGQPTALLTNAGRDALHTQHVGVTATPASFYYMAVSANTTAANAANTTLPGEITTSGGGLIRAAATPAHTAGTAVSTLVKTFTANGSDSLPVTIAKIGIFNAASGVTLGYETLINTPATLSAVGDNVAITETITAG